MSDKDVQQELVHIDNMDLVSYEDSYIAIGASTQHAPGRWVALTKDELLVLVDELRLFDQANFPGLRQVRRFAQGALAWAEANPGKVAE